jgi:phage shock protein E
MNLQTLFRENNPEIIDVREPFEFAMGHVDNAENIPLGNIPAFIDRFRDSARPVVFYCRSGMRSGQAVAFLQGMGVNNIYNGGGLEEVMYLSGAAV